MAIINVQATSNGLNAIQNAINNASNGDTIRLGEGTFTINGRINITKSVNLEGVRNKTILNGFGPTGPQLYISSNNVSITGINFVGGGVFLEAPGRSWNENIHITYCNFDTKTTGSHYHKASLTWTSGLLKSRIAHNTLKSTSFSFWGHNGNELIIENNVVDGAGYGMKVTGYHNNNKNIVVRNNYITRVRAMGFEWQGEFDNLLVEDNYYDKPALSSVFKDNDTSFAYSIIADRSRNTITRRNTCIAPERPDGTGVRIGFEMGGTNVRCEDNYVNGINHVAILNTSVNGRIENNSFQNFLQGPSAYGGRAIGAIIRNNNLAPDQLTWDVNRGIPGVDKSLPTKKGQVPTPAPTPDPKPPIQHEPLPLFFLESPLTSTTVSNGWGPAEVDRSNGEMGNADGPPLHVAGRTYQKGWGTHAPFEAMWNLGNLPGGILKFGVGIHNQRQPKSQIRVLVLIDGQEKVNQPLVIGELHNIELEFPAEAKSLVIKAISSGSIDDAHVDFVNPVVVAIPNVPDDKDKKIKELEDKVADLTNKIDDANFKIHVLETNNLALSNKISTASNKVTELKNILINT